MPALDQLQGGFALAHAALAGQQHAHAVHIHQHAMPRDPGRQAAVEVGDGGEGKLGGEHVGLVDGDVPRLCGFQQLRGRGHAPADDHAGQVVGEILLQHGAARLGLKVFQVGHFHLADDLGPLEGKVFIKAAKLHAGAVEVGGADVPFRFGGRGQLCQLQRLGKPCCLNHAFSSLSTYLSI